MSGNQNLPFTEYLKDALNHLYDPDVLRRSPLVKAGNLEGHPNAPFELQKILADAIQQLKPDKTEKPGSRGWRLYYALFYCFVQQFSQVQAADQMGMSVRQLRRDQYAAIDSLAFVLAHTYGFQDQMDGEAAVQPEPSEANDDWVDDLPGQREALLDQVLPPILEMLRSVAEKYHVLIQVDLKPDLPVLETHPVILRQMILSILNQAIRLPGAQEVRLDAKQLVGVFQIRVFCKLETLPAETAADLYHTLEESMGRLLTRSNGSLVVMPEEGGLAITLSLPSIRKLTVLVLDDHADTIHLLERYGLGSPFRVIGTQDPDELFHLAADYQPQVIFIDIMMPKMDGWEVLSRIRQHPITRKSAVYICSILNEPDLAVELGASGFLRKPIKREEFLSILHRAALQD